MRLAVLYQNDDRLARRLCCSSRGSVNAHVLPPQMAGLTMETSRPSTRAVTPAPVMLCKPSGAGKATPLPCLQRRCPSRSGVATGSRPRLPGAQGRRFVPPSSMTMSLTPNRPSVRFLSCRTPPHSGRARARTRRGRGSEGRSWPPERSRRHHQRHGQTPEHGGRR